MKVDLPDLEWPFNGHELAVVDGDTDSIQGAYFIFAGVIDLVDIFYFDQMIGHSFISVSFLNL